MVKKDILRWGVIVPLIGLVIWIILTPMMSTNWHFPSSDHDAFWRHTPLVVSTIGRSLVQGGLELGTEAAYFGVGRYFFLVYLSIISGLFVFQREITAEIDLTPKSLLGSYKLLMISLIVVTIGDFTSYGLGVFSERLWILGFRIEVLAFLIVLISSIWYGALLMKSGFSFPGGFLIGGSLLVPFLIVEEVLIGYLPNGPVIPYLVVWVLIGIWLLRQKN